MLTFCLNFILSWIIASHKFHLLISMSSNMTCQWALRTKDNPECLLSFKAVALRDYITGGFVNSHHSHLACPKRQSLLSTFSADTKVATETLFGVWHCEFCNDQHLYNTKPAELKHYHRDRQTATYCMNTASNHKPSVDTQLTMTGCFSPFSSLWLTTILTLGLIVAIYLTLKITLLTSL